MPSTPDATDSGVGAVADFPPGTVLLEEKVGGKNRIVLHPIPSDDPNDPLNWSTLRKNLNFGLSCIFVTLTFVQLDNAYVCYEPYADELGVTYEVYNQSIAVNYAGLAVGSIFFIPFIHRYGRRPLYLASMVVQLATCVWAAYMRTPGEVIANSLVGGLGGALSETIAVVTIGDLYFVHHHAILNGIFLLMQSIGAFIGPVIMGYAVENVGWRWMWNITAIMIGFTLVVSFFLFEESKYIPIYHGEASTAEEQHQQQVLAAAQKPSRDADIKDSDDHEAGRTPSATSIAYPRRSYWQRMALVTYTDEPVLRHFYQPFLLFFAIPGVGYAAITYGTMLAWIAMLSSSASFYPAGPPWNLTPDQIGLLSLGPFVGLLIGSAVFSPLSDGSILWLSKRNKGIFEPEMRLWLALPGAILCFIGLVVFGYMIGDGRPVITFLVAYAIYSVGFVICADVALTYMLDCYQNIVGDAMIIVVFTRNIIAVIMLFIYTPWVDALGPQHTYLIVAFLCLLFLLLIPIALLVWGKKLRSSTAEKYRYFSGRQVTYRRQ